MLIRKLDIIAYYIFISEFLIFWMMFFQVLSKTLLNTIYLTNVFYFYVFLLLFYEFSIILFIEKFYAINLTDENLKHLLQLINNFNFFYLDKKITMPLGCQWGHTPGVSCVSPKIVQEVLTAVHFKYMWYIQFWFVYWEIFINFL